MLIRTNTQSPIRFAARAMAQPQTPDLATDSVTLSSSSRRRSRSEIPGFVAGGGSSLAGAAPAPTPDRRQAF